MNKVYKNANSALFDIRDESTIMLGGFGLCGIPENCISALVKKRVNNLTCISNNAGVLFLSEHENDIQIKIGKKNDFFLCW